MANTGRFLLTAVLGLAAIAGCKKRDATVAADSSAEMNMPAFRVTDIDLGRSIGADKRISDKTDSFARSDTLYVSVSSEGSAPSRTLVARWTFEDGQVVNEESRAISPSGNATTEFHVSKPSGWPVGKYKVEILVDGGSVGTKDFEVK